jgi:hypothetical protein
VAFLGNGGDFVFALFGARTTGWWCGAAVTWLFLSVVIAGLVMRRAQLARDAARQGSDSTA